MANQIIVTQSGNVQVSIEPTPNVQVQISRAAIGTISNVPTANFANYAANVTSSSQPNITSLGTLSNLSVSGNTTLNNLVVTGNLQVGNLVANNANYANFAGVANIANTVAGANVTGVVANATFATSAGTSNSATVANTANSVTLANVSGAGNIASINLDGNVANLLTGNGTFVAIPTVSANANYANFAGEAFNVNASNITGTVANANYAANAGNATIANSANSVTLANVSGAGNIASLNLDGNASNILFGNGVFASAPNTANANYANFAGTAFNVSGSNVSGEVANAAYANAANTANLATYATTANSVAGANVSGTVANATFALDAGNSNLANTANSVALANVVGIGNIANINLDGNASNILYGNGVFATTPIISNVANANYANFAGTAYSVSGSNVVGEVANANYASYANLASTANLATFATTANSVAGANVSGEVANANYSSYANIATTANSVALANVVGIGNIANINLDGSSSNVLFGNGVFAPESTSIANANYANFAGNVINGTSNVSIPVANGNVNISTNGNANIAQFDANGALFLYPTTSATNGLRINSYGNPVANDVNRITSFRARGNAAAPLSVANNDNLMRLLAFGHNGNIQQTSSTGSIRAVVDASYTANGANIPIGWNISVNDTNGGINNQAKTHNFYSNGNVVFANSVFAVDSFTSGGNITANTGVFVGNGSGLTNLTGANVTGQVAYAAVANSVAVANVSGIGNIATINLDGNASNVLFGNGVFAPESTSIANANYANFAGNVINGTSNVSIPVANGNVNISTNGNANIAQFDTNGTLFLYPTTSSLNALRITSFGNPSAGDVSRIASSRARGNITTPLSVQGSDRLMRLLTFGHNGANYQTNSIGAFQAQVDANYTANGANIPIGWVMTVNDTNGGVNNQSKNHQFYSNGNVLFNNAILGSSLSVSGNVDSGNVSVTGNVNSGGANVTGTIFTNSLTATGTVAGANITSNGTITGATLSSTGNISAVGNITANNIFSNGIVSVSGNLNAQGGATTLSNSTGGRTLLYMFGDKTTNSNFDVYDTQFSVTMQNVSTTTGFSPFRFQQYAPTSNQFGPMYMFRARGTDFFTQAPVVANDYIMSLNFLTNSNNSTVSIGSFNSVVTYNDNAGNVGSKLEFNASGTGTTGYLNGSIVLNANTTTANNFTANSGSIGNLQLNQFEETVYAIGNTSGTITPDFNNGSIQSLTATGNITLNSLGNAVAGRSMTLIVTQDGTGNRTLTSSMLYAGGSKTLSTAASAKDIISVFYDGSTYFASLTKGYA